MVRVKGARGLVVTDFVASGASAAAGAVPKPDAQAGTSKYLREDATWTTPATLAHASSHKNGGSDEVATATAAANAIPKAGAGGTLAVGWLDATVFRAVNSGTVTRAAATASGTEDVAHGLGVVPRVIWFVSKADAAAPVTSNGIAHGTTLSVCTGTNTLGGRFAAKAIDLLSAAGDGQNANVSAVDATNFTLNWTKAAAGLAVTAYWIALG